MIPLLGHSAGHCGIAIKHYQRGWTLFVVMPIFLINSLNQTINKRTGAFERVLAYDNKNRLHNLARLQHMAQHEPEIELICAHDVVEFERYRALDK